MVHCRITSSKSYLFHWLILDIFAILLQKTLENIFKVLVEDLLSGNFLFNFGCLSYTIVLLLSFFIVLLINYVLTEIILVINYVQNLCEESLTLTDLLLV